MIYSNFQSVLDYNLVDVDKTIKLLEEYCTKVNEKITRAMFERNMLLKREHKEFRADMQPLLAIGTEWDFDKAFEMVMTELMPKLKGQSWKGDN